MSGSQLAKDQCWLLSWLGVLRTGHDVRMRGTAKLFALSRMKLLWLQFMGVESPIRAFTEMRHQPKLANLITTSSEDPLYGLTDRMHGIYQSRVDTGTTRSGALKPSPQAALWLPLGHSPE